MNSRERAMTTLEGGVTDRPPILELLVDPKLLKEASPEGTYEEFARQFGLDLVLTGTPSDMYRKEWIDREARIFTNEWGMKRQYSEQTVSVPLTGPIAEPEDLDSFQPPDPLDPYRTRELEGLLDAFAGEKAVGVHLHDVFNYCYYLRGMENMMMDLILNPDLVHRMVRLSIDHNVALARRAIELGADFILLGDDYGSTNGPLISPDHFREFFLPGLKEVVTAIHEAGGKVIKHCCGDINLLLDMIVLEAGVDALHPLDKVAHMDIAAVGTRYADRLTVCGGVDCAYLLSDAQPEEVTAEVTALLQTMAPRGRFMLASSNSLHHGVRLANYRAAVDTVRAWRNR